MRPEAEEHRMPTLAIVLERQPLKVLDLIEHDVHLRIPTDANHRILATNAVNLGKICDILADIVADDQRAGDVIRRLRTL
jgi:hypothetical protein